MLSYLAANTKTSMYLLLFFVSYLYLSNSFLTTGSLFPFVVFVAPICDGFYHSCNPSSHEALGIGLFTCLMFLFLPMNAVLIFLIPFLGKIKEEPAVSASSRTPHSSGCRHNFCENI